MRGEKGDCRWICELLRLRCCCCCCVAMTGEALGVIDIELLGETSSRTKDVWTKGTGMLRASTRGKGLSRSPIDSQELNDAPLPLVSARAGVPTPRARGSQRDCRTDEDEREEDEMCAQRSMTLSLFDVFGRHKHLARVRPPSQLSRLRRQLPTWEGGKRGLPLTEILGCRSLRPHLAENVAVQQFEHRLEGNLQMDTIFCCASIEAWLGTDIEHDCVPFA